MIKYLKRIYIKHWLYRMGIENYTINDDLTVDVDDTVNITKKNLKRIPIQFGVVSGTFSCGCNKLTSLKGSPEVVGGRFYCGFNKLTSLEYSPREVGENYYCDHNQLTSLKGCPKYVQDTFNCNNNKLTSLEGGPTEVGRDFYCYVNRLTTLKGGPIEVGGDFIDLNINPLPTEVLNFDDIKLLLKHQVEYGIWNSDSSFNKERFKILLQDYNAGILD